MFSSVSRSNIGDWNTSNLSWRVIIRDIFRPSPGWAEEINLSTLLIGFIVQVSIGNPSEAAPDMQEMFDDEVVKVVQYLEKVVNSAFFL